MTNLLHIKNELTIPEDELDVTTTRSGGPGGQHVNKSDTRVIVRWNINTTRILSGEQKMRVVQKLHTRLTKDGDLVVHNSESRSQRKNKDNAFLQLAQLVRKALHVPKRRIATKIPKSEQEKRLKTKLHRSDIKKKRIKKFDDAY